jgi:tRNA-dihydrouridine synthase
MANVTDSVFRKLFAKYGKPDVTWTEFVSADGLVSPGRKNLMHDLEYTEAERPIVAQLFTGHPEAMKKAAALVKKLKFDGLDINMGCPDRAVEKQGGGAANIKNPENAIKVIQAAREGFLNPKSKILNPVSVKTRIGYNKYEPEWIKLLLNQKLPVLTVHLRTRKEMSDVPAHWELMPEIIKMRDEISPETLIIGNGDVESLEQAVEYANKYGCDGVMIGRGIFGAPWFFAELQATGTEAKRIPREVDKILVNFTGEMKRASRHIGVAPEKSPAERLQILLEHTLLFEKTFCPSGKPTKRIKNFAVMKKHFKAYVNGWDGAKELRIKLMETENAKQVGAIVKEYVSKHD